MLATWVLKLLTDCDPYLAVPSLWQHIEEFNFKVDYGKISTNLGSSVWGIQTIHTVEQLNWVILKKCLKSANYFNTQPLQSSAMSLLGVFLPTVCCLFLFQVHFLPELKLKWSIDVCHFLLLIVVTMFEKWWSTIFLSNSIPRKLKAPF